MHPSRQHENSTIFGGVRPTRAGRRLSLSEPVGVFGRVALHLCALAVEHTEVQPLPARQVAQGRAGVAIRKHHHLVVRRRGHLLHGAGQRTGAVVRALHLGAVRQLAVGQRLHLVEHAGELLKEEVRVRGEGVHPGAALRVPAQGDVVVERHHFAHQSGAVPNLVGPVQELVAQVVAAGAHLLVRQAVRVVVLAVVAPHLHGVPLGVGGRRHVLRVEGEERVFLALVTITGSSSLLVQAIDQLEIVHGIYQVVVVIDYRAAQYQIPSAGFSFLIF
mmetsp:Transcript_17392/g.28408  ORF Transcript_17392/g.28408 Transcript_17392/m.28408 type:complete len:275 (-) Transcript_17392:206-1030(-)